jgi:septal ring factor EnvC (AmiA/AmiB activator)
VKWKIVRKIIHYETVSLRHTIEILKGLNITLWEKASDSLRHKIEKTKHQKIALEKASDSLRHKIEKTKHQKIALEKASDSLRRKIEKTKHQKIALEKASKARYVAISSFLE